MNDKINNNEKRILFAIPRMGGGGAEKVTANIANFLVDKGYNVCIITLVSNESFYKLSNKVELVSAQYTVNRNNKFTTILDQARNVIGALCFINKNISDYKPNVIVSFLVPMDILVSMISKLHNIPIIFSERNDPWNRNRLVSFLLKRIYGLSAQFVCQGSAVADYYSNINRKKIAIIPNPINISTEILRMEKTRKNTIVSIGRLSLQKNFKLLINSFSDIANEFPKYNLEIYGEGPLRKILQEQIGFLGLSSRIFLRGAYKDVLARVNSAELFVMSSDYEGFPNALVEAMSLGLPVICTNFQTGIAQELIKEKNGIIVPVGNRELLSIAMRDLLSDDEKREKIRKENKKIKNMLNIENIALHWEEIIDKAINFRK